MRGRRPGPSVALTTLGLVALGCAVLGLSTCGPEETLPPIEVTVPVGATFNSVVDTLISRGILSGRRSFRFYARLTGADRQIRSGRYRLVPGSPQREILETLQPNEVEDVLMILKVP